MKHHTNETSNFTLNKEKLAEWIAWLQDHLTSLKNDWSEVIDQAKSLFEEKRYEAQWAYHELLADVYAKTDEWNSDVKELEHTLKSISAKAKDAWIELAMELKEKLNDL